MALPRYASTSLALQGNQYVSLGNNGLGGLTSFTAEVWVLPTKLSGTQSVLSQFDRGTGTGTFQLYLDDGALFVAIPGKAPLEADVPIALDQWSYLACTYDGSSRQLVLYCNGLEVAQTTIDPPTLVTTSPVVVGAVFTNGAPASGWYLQGLVGRVAVWSSARNAEQILADGSNSGMRDPVAESALELYVDFSTPPAIDQSGERNAVTYWNGAQLQISCPCVYLWGQSSADLGSGSLLDLSGNKSFTIEGWFWAGGPAQGSIASRKVGSQFQYNVEFQAGSRSDAAKLVFFRTNSPVAVSSFDLEFDEWYHFAAVYDGTTSALSLYINGNLQDIGVDAGAAAAGTGTTELGDGFGGNIQNVRFWSVALAQDDIRQWIDNQPVDDPSLLGAFDFTVDPPIDTTDQTAIALTGNAAFSPLNEYLDPNSTEATVGRVNSVNADYLSQDAVTPDAPPSGVTAAPQPAPLSDAHREASWQAILTVLPEGTTAERKAALRSRFEAGYAEAARRIQENPNLAKVFTKVVENGVVRLIYHGPHGDVVAYEGAADATTDCVLWWIQFIFMLTVGFLGAIGLAPTAGSIAGNVATRIYNLVIANPRVVTAINALLGGTITATAGITLIGVLYQEGLIWPILKFALTSLGWWALVWVLKQIIAIVTGLEAAAILAGFIVWAIQLTNLSLEFGSTCGNQASLAG